ncbi:hypothetical protein [Litoreibacter ponti]|nr:hypothetical protein [Litoreibacter ponti]
MFATLTAGPAAFAETGSNTLTLQNGSSFQLQGWTRLNGTTAFKSAETPKVSEPAPRTDLSERQRRLALEAQYQREKAKKAKTGAWGSNY